MAKPRLGKEFRQVYSIRLEPSVAAKVVQDYGSITNFVNAKISAELYAVTDLKDDEHVIKIESNESGDMTFEKDYKEIFNIYGLDNKGE